MKRPRQHIIEGISRKAFEEIIPDEWVYRELSPDYGIDYQVEIFSEGTATGKSFFVQLKGTDSSSKKSSITYYLENETIEYYRKIITPILFVVYSVPEEKFWAIWINNFKSTTSFKADRKKSPIVLKEKNVINNTYFSEIGKKIDTDFFSSPSISITTDGIDESDILSNIINRWISSLWGEFVVFNEPHINHQIIFYISTSGNKFTITVEDSTLGQFEVPCIPFDEHSKYLWFPNIGENLLHTELDDLFLLFSLFTINNFKNRHFNILAALLKRYEGEFLSIQNVFNIVEKYLNKKEYDLLQGLNKSFIENKKIVQFQYFQLSILPHTAKNERVKKLYVESLRFAIDEIDNDASKGTFCYNLANALRSYGNERESIKYYFLARRYQPYYKKKSYWYFELGGVLFLTKHYKFSSKFYKKSLEVNKEYFKDIEYALLADACFMARDFIGAKKYFNIYLDAIENSSSEFVLKDHVIEAMEKNGLDFKKFNSNQNKAIKIMSDINFDEDKKTILKSLDEALNYDPICPQACFNYGVTLWEQGDLDNAFFYFLICSLVAEWNVDAWVYALMIAINLKYERILPYLLDAFLNKHGSSNVLESIRDVILKQNMPMENKRKLFSALETAVNFIIENHGIN